MVVPKLTPQRLLDLLGIQYQERPTRLQLCCPFHHDTNPSASFYLESQSLYCFSCQIFVDMVGFYAKVNEITMEQARRALEAYGVEKNKVRYDKKRLERDRLRAENLLKLMRGGVSDRLHMKLGDAIDQILWAYEQGEIGDERLEELMEKWFEKVQQVKESCCK